MAAELTEEEREAQRLDATRQGARKRLEEEIRENLGIRVSVTEPDHVLIRRGLSTLSALMRQSAKHREPWPTAPTIERVRQAGVKPVEIEVVKDQPKAHRMISHLEAIAAKLPADHIAAAIRLRRANEFLHGGSRVVGYEEATSGGGYRPKLEMTERQQAAGAFRSAMIVGWCDVQRAVIDNFIFEMPAPGASRVLSPEEFGVAYGATKNTRLGREQCFGMIATTLSAIARRARVWDQDQAEIARSRRERGRGAA